MVPIHFPNHKFRIKEEGGKEWIFDEIRKFWVRLTPEEWVRQNLIQYLVQVKNYPASLIAVEKEIWLGDLKKRFDILIYQSAKPWILIECKEMGVSLNPSTLQQILNYHIKLPTPYLVITNGKETYVFEIKEGNMLPIHDFPSIELK